MASVPLNSPAQKDSARVLKANATALLRMAYRSQGQDSWSYKFSAYEVRAVKTFICLKADFAGFDFPNNSLSPTEKLQTSEGWAIEMDIKNLVRLI